MRADDRCGRALPPGAMGLDGLVGRQLGPYCIVRQLSQGGMGTVWEATQDEPRRKVALKTLHLGLTSQVSRQRFHFESELLARLRHPAIAQIYDAGVLEAAGQTLSVPWYALEFVEGARTITDYAEHGGLDLARRLALALDVCGAVQHAHQRGVLHRDLKPANLLVDESGFVKVIDFGIARPRAAGEEEPRLTRTGEILGTLENMSPEQLEGRREEVDARSDVYSLGTVLYELVCGHKPFDFTRLTLSEVLHRIRHEDPTPPSRLRPRVPRELDWICARALAKDPDQRYAGAAELARDLECFLAGEPVAAGPVTRAYRLRKLVLRNKVASAAAALAISALVVGLIATSAALGRARRAERRAGAEAERAGSMLSFVLDGLERPDSTRGPDLRMIDFLAELGRGIDSHFAREASLRGLLHRALGRAYYRLGASESSGEALERSVAELRRGGDEGRLELSTTLGDLAVVRTAQGRLEEADELFAEARSLLPRSEEGEQLASLRLERKRAYLHLARGRCDEAERALQAMLAGGDVDPESSEPYELATALGLVHHRAGRLDEAEEVYARALDRALEQLGPQAPIVYSLQLNLAMVAQARGDIDGAIETTEEVLAEFRQLLGAEHESTLEAANNLAGLYWMTGNEDEAARLWSEALESAAGRMPESHSLLQGLRINLATWELRPGGDAARAETVLAPLYAWRLERLGATDERTLMAAHKLGWALLESERPAEARAILESALAALSSAHPEDHQLLPLIELALARALFEDGASEEASALVEGSLEAIAKGRRNARQASPEALRALLNAYTPDE